MTAIQNAANADPLITFVSVANTLGGSSATETPSSTAYYVDAIHPNELGYQTVFSLPAVQSFFGCPGSPTQASPTAGGSGDGGDGGGGGGLSVGVIAGVAAGGFVGLVVLIAGAYMLVVGRNGRKSSTQTRPARPPCEV